jgi:hypothetical protein
VTRPLHDSLQPSLRITPRSIGLLTLTALVLAACGGSDAEGGGSIAAADSSGVRVVTVNGDPRALPSLRVADTITLGGAAEDFFNGNPQMAFVLGDGRLILSDGRSRGVFGTDGAFAGTFTQFGQGPGELGVLSNIWQALGDSIWTFDGSNRRLSLFTPSLEFARSVQQPMGATQRGYSLWAGLNGDTTAVIEFAPNDQSQTAGKRTSSVRLGLWTIGSDTPVLGDDRPFSEFFMMGGVESGVMMMSAPMGGSAQWRPLGRCMVYGFSTRWEFNIQAPDESLRLKDVALLRAPGDPADPVTPELRERFIVGMLAAYGSPQSQAQVEPIYRNQMTYPDSTPHFSRVFGSRDGALWVQRYRGPTTDAPDHWTVLDLATPRAWRLEVPAGSRLLAVDAGRALIATKDADELESHHWWILPDLSGIQPPAACRATAN